MSHAFFISTCQCSFCHSCVGIKTEACLCVTLHFLLVESLFPELCGVQIWLLTEGIQKKDQLHLLHLRFPPTHPLYFTHTGLNSQLQAITARTHWLTVSRLPLDGSQIEKDSLEYGQCKSISGFVSSRQLVGQTKGCGFENSVAVLTWRQIFIPSNHSISAKGHSLSLGIANNGQSRKYLNVSQDILFVSRGWQVERNFGCISRECYRVVQNNCLARLVFISKINETQCLGRKIIQSNF